MNYSWLDRQFDPNDRAGRQDGPIEAFGIRFNADL
jgi:hypothetical protein